MAAFAESVQVTVMLDGPLVAVTPVGAKGASKTASEASGEASSDPEELVAVTMTYEVEPGVSPVRA